MNSKQFLCVKENNHRLRKVDRIVGFFLYDRLGESIGKIESLLVSNATHHAEYVIVNLGGFLRIAGKSILIPLTICEVEDMGKVTLSLTQESLKDAPAPHDPENPTSMEVELAREYFGIE
ncbi:MAG: hypothetical protein COV66_10750 [Nitrospinae bacterium CG11_big_fil_rev_8_21_14_0_20_45_15]|nr:MAG: hypothetical protein COV66_10750 [Nitrospinae bacterium CG11_big_fil_rev_8_21_14_0_20_45_15]